MSGDRPIFIVGTQRCGTTLLASVLGSHPNIVITPETTLLFNLDGVLRYSQDADVLADIISEHPRWPDFEIPSEMLRRRLRGHETFTPSVVMNEFYDCFRELSGKPRWGDNTPTYSEILPYIAGIWPDACVIHTFRDGRAVAASWFSLPWGPSSIDEAARVWKERIVKCRADSSVVRNFLEVRFEDLVVKLEAETREVCRFIEESFDDRMLLYHELDGKTRYESMLANENWGERGQYHRNIARPPDPSVIDRWKSELDRDQIDAFQSIAGDVLADLGYPLV